MHRDHAGQANRGRASHHHDRDSSAVAQQRHPARCQALAADLDKCLRPPEPAALAGRQQEPGHQRMLDVANGGIGLLIRFWLGVHNSSVKPAQSW